MFFYFQVDVLKKCFDGFADEEGAIPADNVGNILSMMGLKVKPNALRNIIEEIDEDGNMKSNIFSYKWSIFVIWLSTKWLEDINNTNPSFKTIIYFVWPGCWILMCFILGSGLLEFGEFCQLAAKFLVEEDEEGLKKELKEAFRIYDKEGIFRRSEILKAKFNLF